MCVFRSKWRRAVYWITNRRSVQHPWHFSSSFGLSVSWQRAAALPGETHSTRDGCREVSSQGPASAGRRGCEDRCSRQTRRDESHCCKWSWSLPGWKLVLLCDVAERQPAGGSLLLPKYRARGLTHLSPRLLKMTVHPTLKTSVLEEIQIFFFPSDFC